MSAQEELIKGLAYEAVKALAKQCGYLAIPEVDSLIFRDPFTAVAWSDGTTTRVKANDEPFDKEKGLAMAFMRKIYDSRNEFKREIDGAFDEIKFMKAIEEAVSETKPEPRTANKVNFGDFVERFYNNKITNGTLVFIIDDYGPDQFFRDLYMHLARTQETNSRCNLKFTHISQTYYKTKLYFASH